MKVLKRSFRNIIFKVRQTLQLDRAIILQGQLLGEQILSRGRLECLSDAGFGVFSQSDEDGILHWLVRALPVHNRTFVEFGVHDYRESNTRFLLMTQNWSGLIIDGDQDNIDAVRIDGLASFYDLQTAATFIDRDNISRVIRDAGFSSRIGILSVDIDGVDYWVLERIILEADIIVVEYNDFLGESPVSVPYSETFRRMETEPHGIYWGASLSAFRHLLENKGYVFAGTNRLGINAFFVHKDHTAALHGLLNSIVAHPCKIREARDEKRRPSYKRYIDYGANIVDKPLVNVTDGTTVRLGDVCRKIS